MTHAPDVGSAKTIVFAHANGFPAGTYRQLLEPWREAGWRVLALPKIGHDPRYPVTSNWPHLRDQLLHFIDGEAAAPAYLVGHSLGGYLAVLAAARRPEVARGIVLLDSPLLPTWMARTVQFFKASGIGERFSPAQFVQAPPRALAERRCGACPFSAELRRVGIRVANRVTHSRITMLEGGHLLPMECQTRQRMQCCNGSTDSRQRVQMR